MHGTLASETTDLTQLGFSGNDIRVMYLAREPHISDLLEVAVLLSDKDRRLALAILHTFVAFAALSDARRVAGKPDAMAVA